MRQPPTNARGLSLFTRQLRSVSAMLLALASANAAACGDNGQQPRDQPNVLLITVDTLRADHLDAYGYPRATAPAITELARSGVRFAAAVSQAPWTMPSMASVHSSLYPSQHGAVEAETALPGTADTLAKYLRAVGYHTVAVTSHTFVDREHGFAQGFDVFDESNILGHDAVTSESLTRAALAHLENVRGPFFLWVHYFDPHFTYVRHSNVGFADGYEGPLQGSLTAGRPGASGSVNVDSRSRLRQSGV